MDITILENGRLQLSILSLSQEARQDLVERSEGTDEVSFLMEIMEPYSTNGGFTPFDASDGDPFVGLTDSPCIAESMGMDDEGNRHVEGRVWWFPNYMITSPVAELLETGTVEFPLGLEAEPSVSTPAARKGPGL